jgi:hypothetical protein
MTKNNDAFRYIEILTIASDGNFSPKGTIGLKSCGHWTFPSATTGHADLE